MCILLQPCPHGCQFVKGNPCGKLIVAVLKPVFIPFVFLIFKIGHTPEDFIRFSLNLRIFQSNTYPVDFCSKIINYPVTFTGLALCGTLGQSLSLHRLGKPHNIRQVGSWLFPLDLPADGLIDDHLIFQQKDNDDDKAYYNQCFHSYNIGFWFRAWMVFISSPKSSKCCFNTLCRYSVSVISPSPRTQTIRDNFLWKSVQIYTDLPHLATTPVGLRKTALYRAMRSTFFCWFCCVFFIIEYFKKWV